MWFKIPKEFLKTPEASILIELDKEFDLHCNEEAEAVNNKLWETDPDKFDEIEARGSQLHQALTRAVEAFDQATGEPKPIPLTENTTEKIASQFNSKEQEIVHTVLSKTLAYIARQGNFELERIAECIITRANGDLKFLTSISEDAKRDFRDALIE